MKAKINKIKNFEGYVLACEHCGREIKHGFSINGKGCYGSECVINLVSENSLNTAKSQLKDIIRRSKNFEKNYNLTPKFYDRLAVLHGLTIHQFKLEYVNGNINK